MPPQQHAVLFAARLCALPCNRHLSLFKRLEPEPPRLRKRRVLLQRRLRTKQQSEHMTRSKALQMLQAQALLRAQRQTLQAGQLQLQTRR